MASLKLEPEKENKQMDENELICLEEKKERRAVQVEKRWNRLERLARVRGMLPEPKGIFKKRCPECDHPIEKVEFWKGDWKITYYSCDKCDYEYAKRCDMSEIDL